VLTPHRLLLLLILAVAAAVRLVALETVPLGLHGDEAITGLDMRRALRDGYLGPYLYPSALGQPAGPVYLSALLHVWLPPTTATLRAAMALLGVATVALTYLAGRAMFSRVVGLAAAALLATLPWHLHLSRTAFMVNAWPCVAMAAVWLLFRARRAPGRRRLRREALVGLVAGLGVYTYNAYPLTLPLLAVPFAYDLLRPPPGVTRRTVAVGSALAAAAALVAALPLLEYARTHEEYFWHQEEVGVFHTAAWREADWSARAGLLAGRGVEWGRGLLLGGRGDDGDGLGAHGFPLLDPLLRLLLPAGLLLAARRWREPAAGVLIAAGLIFPWGALLTVEDGLFRRTFALAPFLCILAALPIARLMRSSADWRRGGRRTVLLVLAALLTLGAARNTYRYFVPLQDSEQMRYVFPYEIDAAARFIAGLPPGARVHWFSDRWPAHYETLRWYAPHADVVERSPPFGGPADADGTPPLVLDGGAPAVVMLLGRYRAMADAWQDAVPGGTWHAGRRDGEVLFRAYVLPPSI